MSSTKIGYFQTACILVVLRVTVSLTYSPSFFTGGYSSADILALIITLPIVFLEYIPVFFLSKSGGALKLAYDRNRSFGNVVAVAYTLFLVWTAAVSVARFDVFISTSVFSDYIFYGFMLPSILAFFVALKGIEGIGRSAVAVMFLIVLAVMILFFTGVSAFDFKNLVSPVYYGNEALLRSVVSSVSRSTEAAVLCVLVQFVRNKITKAYVWYAVLSTAITLMILLTVIFVIGDFSFVTLFPYDSAVGNIAKWSFLDLEPLLICTWIIGVFVKCSLCVTLGSFCLEKIIKNLYLRSGVSAVLVMAVSFVLARDVRGYSILFTPFISIGIIVVFSVLLPVVILISGGKKCSKKA